MLLGLAAAALATFALVQMRAALDQANATPGASEPGLLRPGDAAPVITGTTIDGASFSLASLRGRPVIVHFWGPSCVPCREEFPLFLRKLDDHQAEGLAIVGVLMYDAAPPARDFVAEFGATWPTVDDPQAAIRNVYRVAARPQSYFIDRDGILQAVVVGALSDAEFERKYALIAGPSAVPTGPVVYPSGPAVVPAASVAGP